VRALILFTQAFLSVYLLRVSYTNSLKTAAKVISLLAFCSAVTLHLKEGDCSAKLTYLCRENKE